MITTLQGRRRCRGGPRPGPPKRGGSFPSRRTITLQNTEHPLQQEAIVNDICLWDSLFLDLDMVYAFDRVTFHLHTRSLIFFGRLARSSVQNAPLRPESRLHRGYVYASRNMCTPFWLSSVTTRACDKLIRVGSIAHKNDMWRRMSYTLYVLYIYVSLRRSTIKIQQFIQTPQAAWCSYCCHQQRRGIARLPTKQPPLAAQWPSSMTQAWASSVDSPAEQEI